MSNLSNSGSKNLIFKTRNHFGQFLTCLQYVRHFLPRCFRFPILLMPENRQIMRDLREQGYSVVPEYLTTDRAEFFKDNVKNLMAGESNVNINDDARIFGIENLFEPLLDFKCDPRLQQLSDAVNKKNVKCMFVMANLLKGGSQGSSGQGWHRDAFVSQFKAMVYLTDVSEKNGPFEIVPRSHKLKNILLLVGKGLLNFNQNRISDPEAVSAMTILEPSVKLTGKAGTLIVFNSTTIHRGHPIVDGERIALTNYYLPKNDFEVIKFIGPKNA